MSECELYVWLSWCDLSVCLDVDSLSECNHSSCLGVYRLAVWMCTVWLSEFERSVSLDMNVPSIWIWTICLSGLNILFVWIWTFWLSEPSDCRGVWSGVCVMQWSTFNARRFSPSHCLLFPPVYVYTHATLSYYHFVKQMHSVFATATLWALPILFLHRLVHLYVPMAKCWLHSLLAYVSAKIDCPKHVHQLR